MNGTKITAEDIFGSKNITINTPIIILRNVNKNYLIPVECTESSCQKIFNIDTERLYNDLENRIQFISRFVPVGQLHGGGKPKKCLFTLLMANSRIFHITNNFEEISTNVWIGVNRKSDRESRTIGTIKSRGVPKQHYPVFPSTFLLRNIGGYGGTFDSNYSDIYSEDEYGNWKLDIYKLNVDRTHLKMIDSAGDISNMYIPRAVTPKDVIDVGYGNDDYNRNIYFTAQGLIVSDANCEPPLDDMNKMTLKECNAMGSLIGLEPYNNYGMVRANDDDQLSLNLNEAAEYDDTFSKRSKGKTFSSGKKLILKERDEPWFSDYNIVGRAANVPNPYKITGIVDNLSGLPLTGTIYGDDDEINEPYISKCVVPEPLPGYSRYEQDESCRGIPIRGTDVEYLDKVNCNENFEDESSDSNMDYTNNIIIYGMCIIIIILLLYRRT